MISLLGWKSLKAFPKTSPWAKLIVSLCAFLTIGSSLISLLGSKFFISTIFTSLLTTLFSLFKYKSKWIISLPLSVAPPIIVLLILSFTVIWKCPTTRTSTSWHASTIFLAASSHGFISPSRLQWAKSIIISDFSFISSIYFITVSTRGKNFKFSTLLPTHCGTMGVVTPIIPILTPPFSTMV